MGVRKYSTTAADLLMTVAQMPAANVTVFMAGRMARMWWQTQVSETGRKRYAAWARKYALAAAGVFAAYVYGRHVHTDPDTGRRRLLLFREETITTIADATVGWLLYDVGWSRLVLDNRHPTEKRVARLMKNVLDANRDVPAVRGHTCTLLVIEKPEMNAFMLPNGFMLVFTGMAENTNDDQLSIIIGHEIGHLIRQHGNQTASCRVAAGALELVADLTLSSTLPLFPAVLACAAIAAFVRMWLLHFNRQLELEADRDGLLLAARACVDPAEGPKFWSAMADKFTNKRFSWLSTHPSDRLREHRLLDLLPKAAKVRAAAGCDDRRP